MCLGVFNKILSKRLHPLPTWLLKLCSSELVAVITAIINSSLESSTVPDAFKQAVVRPVLKKVTLDEDALCSYRLISNLPFLSKLVEKVIARQLNIHLDMNTLRDPFQSAYRHGHSTETALLRVKNDIAATLDEKGKVVLVMLDLSSAFDTINHDILMNRLQHSVGITDAALSWLHSYITERYQRVAVDSATSADCVMKCGVPQGSVLGPILYCIYKRPIGDIVARHGLKYHCYADDTQIYMAVKHNQPITEAISKIEQCLTEVTDWYGKNQLKLNTEKSEAVIFLTKTKRNDLPCNISVTIDGHRVVPKPSVRNLGVILDSGLTMQAHVAQIAKSCYHQIRNIGQIRSSITDEACKTLIHALVTARLDYANALLYGLPQTTLQRLQRVQNCAARLVSRTRKYDHITPVLQHLHWLPICVRPTYKVLMFVYSVMHEQAPCYLAELLSRRQSNRRLRSASLPLLRLPASQTVTHGDRRFAVAAAALWNGLPDSVRTAKTQPQYKTLLKTHLFRLAFL